MDKGRYYFSGELDVIGSQSFPSGVTYLKVRPDRDTEWLFLPESWLDADTVLEEPPLGSVVLDDDGDAWQNDVDGWYCALRLPESDAFEWSWTRLVEEYGVSKVIYEAKPEDD